MTKKVKMSAETEIMHAKCNEGSFDKAIALIEHRGADINSKDCWGRTALMKAALGGFKDVCLKLIELKANPFDRSKVGLTAYDYARRNDQAEVYKMLKDVMSNAAVVVPEPVVVQNMSSKPEFFLSPNVPTKDDSRKFLDACSAGMVEDIRSMVKTFGEEILRCLGPAKITSLMCAVSENNEEAVNLIASLYKENGISLNGQTTQFKSALSMAVINNNPSIVESLLKNGCDVEFASNNGLTPFMVASYYGYVDVMNVLMAHGCKIGGVSKKGFTALDYARKQNNVDAISLICSRLDSDPSLKASSVESKVVHVHQFSAAARRQFWKDCKSNRHINVERSIRNRTVDLNSQEQRGGKTPLMIAATYNSFDCVKAIVEAGADLHCKSAMGKRAVDYAPRGACKSYLEEIMNKEPDAVADPIPLPVSRPIGKAGCEINTHLPVKVESRDELIDKALAQVADALKSLSEAMKK
jgi:ankyrin repeat protein